MCTDQKTQFKTIFGKAAVAALADPVAIWVVRMVPVVFLGIISLDFCTEL